MSIFLISIGIIAVLLIIIVSVYNKLVKNRNLMQEAWSSIDVFLKKRHDLIPGLVETVKGYAAHEKSTLEDITRFRSQAMQAKDPQSQMQSENGLGKALANLLVSVENYPDLKANTNFLEFQQQLKELEDSIETSRRYYNGTVRENNIAIESFPSNIIAQMFGFHKGDFFAVDSSEKEVPKFSF